MLLPTQTVPITTEATAKKVLRLLELFEDHDDVQNVYANFDIPDDIFEAATGLNQDRIDPAVRPGLPPFANDRRVASNTCLY